MGLDQDFLKQSFLKEAIVSMPLCQSKEYDKYNKYQIDINLGLKTNLPF